MKKIVLSGSSKLQDKIKKWLEYFEERQYEILDFPRPIEQSQFISLWPNIHKTFFENITETDILFIMNEDKNGIEGYIGAETFAELTFGIVQNLIYNKKIELILLKIPSQKVQCYDEIKTYLELGWIKLFEEN